MSMDRCTRCSRAVDTDLDYEFYDYVDKNGNDCYCYPCRREAIGLDYALELIVDNMLELGIDVRMSPANYRRPVFIFDNINDMNLYKISGRYKEGYDTDLGMELVFTCVLS